MLLSQVARETGLPECMVYLGGQDQKLAALGAGIEEGTVTVSLGTASAVTRLTAALPDSGVEASVFRFDDSHFSLEGVLDTSGGALKWLMGIIGGKSYEEMNRLAQEAGSAGGLLTDNQAMRRRFAPCR
jgi:xylulokinase